MTENSLFDSVKNIFIGRIFSSTSELFSDGGPRCYNQLTNEFRFSVYFAMSLFHLSLYFLFTKSHLKPSKSVRQSPKLVEKILGCLQLVIFCLQIIYKSLTLRLIFCLNHCHLCTLMQSYLFLSCSSEKNKKFFAATLVWSTGAFLAVVYPEPGLITYPGELELFWLQHLLTGVFCPIILVAYGRYNDNYCPDILSILYGYHSFSWFCRLVQGPASVLTWANINFQLCFPDDQDIFLLFGKFYLPIAELCVIPVSIGYVKGIFFICRVKEWVFGGKKKID